MSTLTQDWKCKGYGENKIKLVYWVNHTNSFFFFSFHTDSWLPKQGGNQGGNLLPDKVKKAKKDLAKWLLLEDFSSYRPSVSLGRVYGFSPPKLVGDVEAGLSVPLDTQA